MSRYRSWIIAGISLVLFVVFFFLTLSLGRAGRPRTVDVLAAARALEPGDVLTDADLTVISVYEDARTALYLPPERRADIVGGVVTEPLAPNEPITVDAVVAPAVADQRLAGLLAEFPDHALFPLPLDHDRVTAPAVDAFHPGDIVLVTLVFPDRPEEARRDLVAPQAPSGLFVPAGPAVTALAPTPTPTPGVLPYEQRGVPPLAWSPSPSGYRVVRVDGQTPEPTASETPEADSVNSVYGYTGPETRPVLYLLVPRQDVQALTMGLTTGRVYVSWVWQAAQDDETDPGFSYWDLEAIVEAERRRLATPAPAGTGTPRPAPSATPTAKPATTPTATPAP